MSVKKKKYTLFLDKIFKEINKKNILAGLKNPIGFKKEVFEAQQARRITDRFVGFKLVPHRRKN